MKPAARDAGFTLVEMLVSMALLAMAAVLVAQGLLSDREALRRIEAHTTSGEEVGAAQDVIRDRVEGLFARTQYDAAGPHVDVEGSSNVFAFLSAVSVTGGVAQIQRLRLDLNANGELILEPETLTGDPLSVGRGSVLLRNVRTFELAYYGPSSPDGRAAWRPAWSRQVAPPELVRIRVGFADADRRLWPELIVRPAATVDTSCALDPATALCRGRS